MPALLLMEVPPDANEKVVVVGVRKYGEDILLREADSLPLGSLTKAMTATLTAKLIEDGVLSWDSTIQDVFHDSDFQIDPGYQSVTVEMLCAHRSGFTGDSFLGDAEFFASLYAQNDPIKGRVTYLSRAFTLPPSHAAGTFAYSNINYIVLGHMIDRHAGAWEEVTQSRLWVPLGMTACGLGPAPESSLLAIENPWPHVVVNSISTPVRSDSDNPPFVNPAGRVHCAASSYAIFLRLHLLALIDPTSEEASNFLSEESWGRLHSPYLNNSEAETLYTPGGWLYSQSSSDGTTLSHTGTNTYNYAQAFIASRTEEAVLSFANVGDPVGYVATEDAVQQWLSSRASNGSSTSSAPLASSTRSSTSISDQRGSTATPTSAQPSQTASASREANVLGSSILLSLLSMINLM